jgi:hypothetical protein
MAFRNVNHQLSFLEGPEIDAAIAGMEASDVESRGAVFTRREVVDFILDLAGYTTDKPLHLGAMISDGHGGSVLLMGVTEAQLQAHSGNLLFA